jgi:hypothetical protein
MTYDERAGSTGVAQAMPFISNEKVQFSVPPQDRLLVTRLCSCHFAQQAVQHSRAMQHKTCRMYCITVYCLHPTDLRRHCMGAIKTEVVLLLPLLLLLFN